MACLGQAFSQLHQYTGDFNLKHPYGKNEVQEKIFFSLQNSFNHWSEKTVRVVKTMQTTLLANIEWSKSEFDVIKEVLDF